VVVAGVAAAGAAAPVGRVQAAVVVVAAAAAAVGRVVVVAGAPAELAGAGAGAAGVVADSGAAGAAAGAVSIPPERLGNPAVLAPTVATDWMLNSKSLSATIRSQARPANRAYAVMAALLAVKAVRVSLA
jgi:hypothetical protein